MRLAGPGHIWHRAFRLEPCRPGPQVSLGDNVANNIAAAEAAGR